MARERAPGAGGPLEQAILEVLWKATEPLSGRDILSRMQRRPSPAYTTVMTVLDRLHAKGLVRRSLEGRSLMYAPAQSLARHLGEQAAGMLAQSEDRRAVLVAFLESTETADPELLSELSALIRRHRAGGGS